MAVSFVVANGWPKGKKYKFIFLSECRTFHHLVMSKLPEELNIY